MALVRAVDPLVPPSRGRAAAPPSGHAVQDAEEVMAELALPRTLRRKIRTYYADQWVPADEGELRQRACKGRLTGSHASPACLAACQAACRRAPIARPQPLRGLAGQ